MGLDQYLYRCAGKYIPDLPTHGQDTFIEWVDGCKVYNEVLDTVITESRCHGKEVWYGRKACIVDNILQDVAEPAAFSHDEYNTNKNNITSKTLYYVDREGLIQLENMLVRKLRHFPIFGAVYNNKKDVTADDMMKLFTCKHILEPLTHDQTDTEDNVITSHILVRLSSIKSKYRNVDFTEFIDKLDDYPEYSELLMFMYSHDTEDELTRRERTMFSSIGRNEQDHCWYDMRWEYDQLIRLFVAVHNELTNKYTNQLEWYYYRSY